MAIQILGNTIIDDSQNITSTGNATFGGTVDATGFTVNGSPITAGGSGSQTIVSDTAPDSASYNEGTLWWNSDSTDTSLYVLYQDPAGPNGDLGGKYWVEASPSQDTITDTNMLVVGRSTNSSVPISSGSLVIIGRSGDIAVPV